MIIRKRATTCLLNFQLGSLTRYLLTAALQSRKTQQRASLRLIASHSAKSQLWQITKEKLSRIIAILPPTSNLFTGSNQTLEKLLKKNSRLLQKISWSSTTNKIGSQFWVKRLLRLSQGQKWKFRQLQVQPCSWTSHLPETIIHNMRVTQKAKLGRGEDPIFPKDEGSKWKARRAIT